MTTIGTPSSRRPPAPAASPGPSHIPVLDGLRGVAILLVLLHHFTFYGDFRPNSYVERVVYELTMAGWSGVDLFFVLSGFLITRLLYDAKGSEFFFRHFYIRRTLRIFPLYYATLAAFFVAGPLLFQTSESFERLLSAQSWYWTYLVNVDVAIRGWPEFHALGHFWSLAVEEQFYLVWPFLVFLLNRRDLVRVCIAAIVVAFAVRAGLAWNGEPLAAYVLSPARMDALALGSLLALAAADRGGLLPWRRSAWLVGLGSAAVLFAMVVWEGGLREEHPVTVTAGFTLIACFFGSGLVLAVTSPERAFLARVLTSVPLTVLGRYSYALYVVHHPLVIFLRTSSFRVTDLPTVLGSQLPALAVYTLIVGGASLGMALVSWHLLERPFLRLKDRFPYSRQARPLPAPRLV